MKNENINSRRSFLKSTALAGAAVSLGTIPYIATGREKESLLNIVTTNAGEEKISVQKGKSVMDLACKPIPIVRIGIIGVGMRGSEAVGRLLQIEGIEIKAVADIVPNNVNAAVRQITVAGKPEPTIYTAENDWEKICTREDIDLIYNCTPWHLHTPIAVYAMKHGKHAAIEVPGGMTLEECWQLVDTAEETQRHCMMLENCCYDFFELNTLNMARNDVFGEILHAEGAYIHDLRWLKFDKTKGYVNMWRLDWSKSHTGNLYPTHGLGPIAQIMGINRGDRFDYLTGMSTKQSGMTLYAEKKFGANSQDTLQPYKLGDMHTTMLHTVNGKTLLIQHDTTSPRPYDRKHILSGTKGYCVKYPEKRIALEPDAHHFLTEKEQRKLMKEYEHPLVKQIGKLAKKVGGHGGMDFIMDYRLIHCLQKGLPLDQDVYDAATWSCLVELSEQSVLNQSNSVKVPDFTRGAWQTAKPWGIVTI